MIDLRLGDALDVLRSMPADSVHSCVTDPPYELSDSREASPARIAAKVLLPKNAKRKAEVSGECCLGDLVFEIAGLCGVTGLPRPASAVPVVAVTLNDCTTRGDHNVEDAAPAPGNGIAYRDAAIHAVPEAAKYIGRFALECADPETLVDALHSLGTSFFAGGIGVGFSVTPSGFPGFTRGGPAVNDGDEVVGVINDALALRVCAGCGAEHLPVARIAAATGTVNVLSARSATVLLSAFQLAGAKLVRARAGTRGLASVPDTDCVRYVAASADGAVAFDLLTHHHDLSSTGFMGKAWDGSKIAFDPLLWREVFRVLKPGGHLLAFAATRTHHRMTCAIEDAGFEIRDTIVYLYGSGFPKSLDISKAIDRAAGAEREVVGSKLGLPGYSLAPDRGRGVACVAHGDSEKECAVTAPATDAARTWQGWGTALKPALEPITLARKPLAGTVAANVLEHGTGGINVDGCRISWRDDADRASGRPASFSKAHEGFEGKAFAIADRSHRDPVTEQASGRFPANLILGCACDGDAHDPGCAVAMLDAHKGDTGGASRFFHVSKLSEDERWSSFASCAGESLNLASDDSVSALANVVARETLGLELLRVSYRAPATNVTARAFAMLCESVTALIRSIEQRCLHGLPLTRLEASNDLARVVALPARTAITTITASLLTSDGSAASVTFDITATNAEVGERVSGSRFIYTAKASRAERENGLAGMEPRRRSDVTGRDEDGAGQNNPRAGVRRRGEIRNVHTTVKPLDLMRYLCRLVTPPKGIVLDPFMGSGTTGWAARLEGFSFVGIERESEYFEIARRRVEGNGALFELAVGGEP